MSTRSALTLLTRSSRIAGAINRNAAINKYVLTSATPHASLWRFYTSEKSAEKVQQAEAAPTSAAEAHSISEEAAKQLAQEVEKLRAEVKTLAEKHEDLLNKYKRALADSENLRVRLTKQIADAKVFGIQSFCKDLLEVADILGHATAAVPQEELKDDNPHLKNLYEGLSMTKASLLQVFKRHGLEPLNPLHEKFDPHLHEALFQKEDASVEPNVVVEVTKLGYKLHDRCIRPALVGVSKSS